MTSTNLNNIFTEDLSQKDIARLIMYCYPVSYATLNNFSDKTFIKKGTSLEDLAINSVASLFSKNGNDKSKVETYLYEKRNNLKCEADLHFYLNKLIWERVEKDLCWEMALADEKFEDIYLNLILLLRSEDYKRIFYLSNSFVVSSNNRQINRSVIDTKSFNELPGYLFSQDLANSIKDILKYLEGKTKFYPAIPCVPLIIRISK